MVDGRWSICPANPWRSGMVAGPPFAGSNRRPGEGFPSVMVVNPVLNPEGDRLPVRHPPILSAYIASGLREAGSSPSIVDLYHEGRNWTACLRFVPAPDVCVVVHKDYDRPLPFESLSLTVFSLNEMWPDSRIVIAGLSNPDESGRAQTLLGSIVSAVFQELPEVFIPRWLSSGQLDSRTDASRSDLQPRTCEDGLPGLDIDSPPQQQPSIRHGGLPEVDVDSQTPQQPSIWNGELPRVDIDSLPYPAWELLDMAVYGRGAAHRHKYEPVLPIMAIRGCPNNCAFCDKGAFGNSRVVTLRNPEKVAAEVQWLRQQFGVNEVQFAEPNFIVSRDWALAMCAQMRAIKPGIPWSCHVRIDQLDRELVSALSSAGCWNILFGVESASDHVRKLVRKPMDPEHVRSAVTWSRKSGLETTASYVLGLPGDTPATIEETIRFACELDSDYAQFFIHKAQSQPLLPGDRVLPDWDFLPFDIPGRPYLPAAFESIEQIRRLQAKAYRSFYLRPRSVARRLWKLRSVTELRRLVSGGTALIRLIRGVS